MMSQLPGLEDQLSLVIEDCAHVLWDGERHYLRAITSFMGCMANVTLDLEQAATFATFEEAAQLLAELNRSPSARWQVISR